MQKQKLITTWHKGKVEGGQDEQDADISHIPHVDIILMLISPDFMEAHYRDGTGVEQALARRKTGTIVIPILLRLTDWRTSPFGGIQPLPLNGKPVKQWSDDDEAFYEITSSLRKIVEGVIKNKGRDTIF